MKTWRVLALLPLVLAACDTLRGVDAGDEPPVVTDIRGESTEISKVLAYYVRSRKLAGPELAREQEAARRALARTRTDVNRVRYALTLAVPGAAAQDDGRVLELLEPVARNGDSALHGLALLVTAFLQEQRRLDGNVQGLQQKLDALLTLERSMTGREAGTIRKR